MRKLFPYTPPPAPAFPRRVSGWAGQAPVQCEYVSSCFPDPQLLIGQSSTSPGLKGSTISLLYLRAHDKCYSHETASLAAQARHQAILARFIDIDGTPGFVIDNHRVPGSIGTQPCRRSYTNGAARCGCGNSNEYPPILIDKGHGSLIARGQDILLTPLFLKG